LRQLVVNGARPAIAFEQFDREWQANIDRARHERPRDADCVSHRGAGGTNRVSLSLSRTRGDRSQKRAFYTANRIRGSK
jgi:hypothetical protein